MALYMGNWGYFTPISGVITVTLLITGRGPILFAHVWRTSLQVTYTADIKEAREKAAKETFIGGRSWLLMFIHVGNRNRYGTKQQTKDTTPTTKNTNEKTSWELRGGRCVFFFWTYNFQGTKSGGFLFVNRSMDAMGPWKFYKNSQQNLPRCLVWKLHCWLKSWGANYPKSKTTFFCWIWITVCFFFPIPTHSTYTPQK